MKKRLNFVAAHVEYREFFVNCRYFRAQPRDYSRDRARLNVRKLYRDNLNREQRYAFKYCRVQVAQRRVTTEYDLIKIFKKPLLIKIK